jgi:hypothetical protein
MPYGTYPRPLVPSAAQPAHAQPGLRMKVWWNRRRLDDLLARGADPASSAALLLRAEQLGRPGARSALATAIQAVVREAHRRPPVFSVQVPMRRAEVITCSGDLLALAQRLRDDSPVDVQGIAMASRLLSDGASPLYYRNASHPLRYSVRSARLALDPMRLDVDVRAKAA